MERVEAHFSFERIFERSCGFARHFKIFVLCLHC